MTTTGGTQRSVGREHRHRRGRLHPWTLLLAVAFALPAVAAELTLELAAQIAFEESLIAAQAKSPPDEPRLPPSERSERIAQQQQALQALYERHGTDAKSYARYVARLSVADTAKLERLTQQLREQAAAGKGIPIQRGFDEQLAPERVPPPPVPAPAPGKPENEDAPKPSTVP